MVKPFSYLDVLQPFESFLTYELEKLRPLIAQHRIPNSLLLQVQVITLVDRGVLGVILGRHSILEMIA